MISVRSVVKSVFNTSKEEWLRLLDGATLEIPKGQVAALVGPSGSGKSTLLRCINGLEQFQGGEIAVGEVRMTGGTPPRSEELLRLRRSVGMVFQEFNLFPHMTALENVMAGPVYALGRRPADVRPLAEQLLDRVGLGERNLKGEKEDPKYNATPAQLSGGQKQRVAIARALAVNPSAILFDEPTSALDPQMSAEVMRVIDDLASDEALPVAMVIVSHDLGSVKRIADAVHVLEKGRVVYSGPAAEAFAPGGRAAALE